MSATIIATALAVGGPAAVFGLRSIGRVGGLAAVNPAASAVLITGCSSGIGLATAQKLSSDGVTVFATVRKETDADKIRADNLIPLLCDVTIQDEVQALHAKVEAELQSRPELQLTGIVNNAGILMNDPDELDIEVLEKILAVNVFGVYRVTQAFLPLLEKLGSTAHGAARVVTIGSYFGDFIPGSAHLSYGASKHALEPFSDGLRRRLAPKGVHVALVKPGNIATEMNKDFAEATPDVVADAISDALFSSAPLTRYYPGTFGGMPNRVACFLFASLPDRIADKLWKWKLG